jgi:hypothetical protein
LKNLETIACKFYFSLKLVADSKKNEISFFIAFKQTLDASAENSAYISLATGAKKISSDDCRDA